MDNFAFSPGSGATGASDEIGGIHYPRVKVTWGADGAATDASAAAPLPVVQTGTPALPTGAATEATSLRSAPARYHEVITPANTNLSPVPQVIYVAVQGNIIVRDAAGVDVTYAEVPVGPFPFAAVQIRTGTTATIVGWYQVDPAAS